MDGRNEREYRSRQRAKNRIIREKTPTREVESKDKNRKPKKKPLRVGDYVYATIVLVFFLVIIGMSAHLLFYVQKITVKNNEFHGATEIAEYVQANTRANYSLATWYTFEYETPELPVYLEKVDISIVAPWHIEAKVTEKPIAGGVQLEEEFVYFEQEGHVVNIVKDPIEGIPMIEGIEIEEPVLYQELEVDNDKIFNNLLLVTELVEENNLNPEDIICPNGAEINLIIGGVTVQLGDDNFSDKIVQIAPALSEIEGKDGVLHLENFDINSGIISFEPKSTENLENSID